MSRDKAPTAIHVAFDEDNHFDETAPEKSLLSAILQSALSDLRRGGPDRRKAIEYFLSPDEDYIFSFKSVCDLLSVDHNRVLVVAGLKAPLNKRPEISLNEINFEALVRKH